MKSTNNLESIENKILISCLGIAALTIIFYLLNNSKQVEGMGIYASEGPFDTAGVVIPLVNANSDINTILTFEEIQISGAITDAIVEASAAVTDSMVEEAKVENLLATQEAKIEVEDIVIAESIHTRETTALESSGNKIMDRLNRIVGVAGTATGIAAAQAQNTLTNAQNVKTYQKQAGWNSKAVGMFTNFWQVGLLGFLVAGGVGSWAIKNIEVLIYRVMNFKSCFFWYTLEIIGWVLYLPVEFIVWLFCLQEFEKGLWKMLDAFDCFIYGFIGFYLFKHSDEVNKKCYSKVFTPFPNLSIPFSFDTIGKYMGNMDEITNQLTSEYGTPDEIDAGVEKSVQEAQQAAEIAKALDITSTTISAAQASAELTMALIP